MGLRIPRIRLGNLNLLVDFEHPWSRRDFLGVGIVQAIATSSLNVRQLFEDLRIEVAENTASISLPGRNPFLLAAANYAGRPNLKATQTDEGYRLALSGARFPGLSVSADCIWEFCFIASRWSVRRYLPIGTFGEADLHDWLGGKAPLTCQDPNKYDAHPGPASLSVGPSTLSVTSDGRFVWSGTNSVRFSNGRANFIGHELSLTHAIKASRNLLDGDFENRSSLLLKLQAGRHQIDPPQWDDIGATVRGAPQSISELCGESAESSDGSSLCLAARLRDAWSFSPRGISDSLSGGDLTIHLDNLTAAYFGTSTGESSSHLVGKSVSQASQATVAGVNLFCPGGTGLFRFSDGVGLSPSLTCSVPLQDLHVSLDNALVQTPRRTTESVLNFLTSGLLQDDSGLPRGVNVVLSPNGPGVIAPAPSLAILRASDLLSLTFEFHNLHLIAGSFPNWFKRFFLFQHVQYPRLVRIDSGLPAFISVHFPPQHVFEKGVFEDASGDSSVLPLNPVQARLSGPSRLVFRIPDDVADVEYRLEHLLDWSKLEPSIVPHGVSRIGLSGSSPVAPTVTQTSLELPYRLLLSPNEHSGWAHSVKPVEADDKKQVWTELWHTRLGVRDPGFGVTESNSYLRTVRAIWRRDSSGGANQPANPCPSLQPATPGSPIPEPQQKPGDGWPMDENDRYEIVNLSSNFKDLYFKPTGAPQVHVQPEAIQVHQLMLTSIGAWVEAEGSWAETEGFSVRNWNQQSSMGRDGFVRVVYGGFLYPFQHRATLTKITERKFQRKNSNSPIKAYLRQRFFLRVEEPTVRYGEAGNDGVGDSIDRQLPFRSLTICTKETPNLDQYTGSDPLRFPCYFWPKVLGKQFLFSVEGIDLTGRRVQFDSPAIFLQYRLRNDPGALNAISQAWINSGAGSRSFFGQKLAMAQERDPGDTTLEIDELTFDGTSWPAATQPLAPNPLTLADASVDPCVALSTFSVLPAGTQGEGLHCSNQPPPPPRRARPAFHPVVRKAKVKLPAVSAINPSVPNVPIVWQPDYLKHGFTGAPNSPNFGEVFGKLDIPKPSFSLPDAKGISLFRPDFNFEGLSRKFGVINDIDGIKLGDFRPDRFFQGDFGKFLGVIDIKQILLGGLLGDLGQTSVPQVQSRTYYDSKGIPERVEAWLDWTPTMKGVRLPPIEITTNDAPNSSKRTSAYLRVQTNTVLRQASPEVTLEAQVKNFTVEILQAVQLDFSELRMASKGGRTDVKVDIEKVKFKGGLEFVAKLQEKFSKSLFGAQGPRIEISPRAITARAGFALPGLSFGAFSLRNLSFSAGIVLPLGGNDPVRISFGFGDRTNRFLVAVAFLGGGGYLLMEMDARDGVHSIELAIEAGAVATLELGVANGSLYVFLGLWMLWERGTGTKVAGYLRAGGSLDVLGIITVSVEFNLSLGYAGGMICGKATLTIRIKIGFFSKDVDATLERCFAAGNSQQISAAPTGVPTKQIGATSTKASTTEDARVRFETIMSQQQWNTYWDAFAR